MIPIFLSGRERTCIDTIPYEKDCIHTSPLGYGGVSIAIE